MSFSGRLLLVTLAVAVAAPAGLASGASREERAVSRDGSFAERLVLEMRRVFAPATLPEEMRAALGQPLKSATGLVREYDAARGSLSAASVRLVDGWLRGSTTATQALESEHFRFSFSTDGPDAVPAEDVAPANGIPDFVERVAAWGETAWSRLVDEAGFTAPRFRDGRVDVSFRTMEAYGFTRLVDGIPALTLHSTFDGFPANSDPEGSAAGAAKVTMAHELKHASQHAASGWTEGGWLEADATWAEDFVFDETDDYVRLLAEGSPVSDPAGWTTISYEDCLFPRLLAERHGTAVLADFFARRAAFRTEPVWSSFDAVLRVRGSSLADAAAALGLWSWFCGSNAAGRPIGFEEADLYPTPPLAAHVDRRANGHLGGLGTHHVLATAVGRTDRPRVAFAGDRDAPFALWAVTLDRSGRRAFLRVPIAGANSGAIEIPRDWDELATLVVIVTNVGTAAAAEYGITLDDEGAVDVPIAGSGARFLVLPNRPNPFRDATTLAFSLPSPARVRVSIHDAGGRLVRRLVDGIDLEAGLHERAWDGRDGTGRLVAPGFYAVRVEADGLAAARKVLVLR